jgi:hypothetical protein
MARLALRAAVTAMLVGPASAMTVIDVPVPDWEWEMVVDPIGTALGPTTVIARGDVVMRFDSKGAFDFGTLEDPLPVPKGTTGGTIDIEIVSMSLTGSSPVFVGPFEIGLQDATSSKGQITNLSNEDGVLAMDVFFDVFVDISLPDMMSLMTEGPISFEMKFGPEDGIPEDDVLWPPFFVWSTIMVPPAVDPVTGMVWDDIVEVHTIIPGMAWVVPEPGTAWLLLGGVALLVGGRRASTRVS